MTISNQQMCNKCHAAPITFSHLFGDPSHRKDITECPMCGFFSLPCEPVYYQDTTEGIAWAEWASNECLKHERPWEYR